MTPTNRHRRHQGDPFLSHLHTSVTLEELHSYISLEHGQAVTVNVMRGDDVALRKDFFAFVRYFECLEYPHRTSRLFFNCSTIYMALPGGAGWVWNKTHYDHCYYRHMQELNPFSTMFSCLYYYFYCCCYLLLFNHQYYY